MNDLKEPSSLVLFSLLVLWMFHRLVRTSWTTQRSPISKSLGQERPFFVCDLDLLVLAVGYEPVVVNEPLDGVREQGSG